MLHCGVEGAVVELDLGEKSCFSERGQWSSRLEAKTGERSVVQLSTVPGMRESFEYLQTPRADGSTKLMSGVLGHLALSLAPAELSPNLAVFKTLQCSQCVVAQLSSTSAS